MEFRNLNGNAVRSPAGVNQSNQNLSRRSLFTAPSTTSLDPFEDGEDEFSNSGPLLGTQGIVRPTHSGSNEGNDIADTALPGTSKERRTAHHAQQRVTDMSWEAEKRTSSSSIRFSSIPMLKIAVVGESSL